MFLPILAAIVFAVTMALAMSFFWFFVETPLARRKMMTRLSAIQEVAARDEHVTDVLRKELLSDVPFFNRLLATMPGVPQLKLFLEQGAVRMQVGTFVLLIVALPIFTFTACLLLALPMIEIIPLSLGAAGAPFVVTGVMRAKRFSKFEEQFPEAMDLLGRAVRAGHAFTTGFELIGKELPDPLGEEFRVAFQQQNLGLPLREALGNLTVRMPLPDVRIFVSALQIQRESGGNLAEVLDTMSHVVRERFKLRRQIRTYTAEGRLSCYMLTVLPFLAMLGLHVFRPGYINVLFTDPSGQMALVVAAVLEVIGYFVIRRIIDIKV